ncbi:MAG TPA: tRNA guanosine(34) transglycosylase Tgt, partial [Vicinamibacterales bacterium]|nr:tRNA guanosine(34) transglycosylase Tgt [Vicinamibacterales bacterium]
MGDEGMTGGGRWMGDGVFSFSVTATDGAARRGVMATPHGEVETPCFMPVGTRGAVKAITHRDLEDLGATIILGNTYHLHLRPGDALVARAGGLHRFIGWPHPILTDSGGYQVFSLAAMRRVTEAGVQFRSHLDGALHMLTPESATDIQARLGSDIAMVLDELVGTGARAPDAAGDEAREAHAAEPERAMERTARWAARARARMLELRGDAGVAEAVARTNPGQAQFGIVQGGTDPALRTASLQRTVEIGFEGYAIGGLSVGEPVDVMYDVVAHTAPQLPERQPRYLMGTGMPDDLVECVARGIDMFDCVLPTRNARNGQLLTRNGVISIKNAQYAEDSSPPDPDCGCFTCRRFTRAYLRHLYVAGEMGAATLNTVHN